MITMTKNKGDLFSTVTIEVKDSNLNVHDVCFGFDPKSKNAHFGKDKVVYTFSPPEKADNFEESFGRYVEQYYS